MSLGGGYTTLIKPFRLEEVRAARAALGVSGMTVTEVKRLWPAWDVGRAVRIRGRR